MVSSDRVEAILNQLARDAAAVEAVHDHRLARPGGWRVRWALLLPYEAALAASFRGALASGGGA